MLLPVEILSDILILSVSSPGCISRPSQLMLVCRHWHDVAIATPRLWCRLHVDFRRGVVDDPAGHDNVVSYLARSLHFPLQIHLSHIQSCLDSPIQSLFHALQPSMPRWQTLHVTESSQPKIYCTLPKCVDAWPFLQRLVVAVEESNATDTHSPLMEQALQESHSAPMLRELILYNVGAHSLSRLIHDQTKMSTSPEPNFIPRIDNLTHLFLKITSYSFSLPDIFGLLQDVVQLQSFSLNMPLYNWYISDDSIGRLVTMPVLHTLRINIRNNLPLLMNITTPALETLQVIEHPYRRGPLLEQTILGLIARSSSPLRILRLAGVDIRDIIDTDECHLSRLPDSLEELSICHGWYPLSLEHPAQQIPMGPSTIVSTPSLSPGQRPSTLSH